MTSVIFRITSNNCSPCFSSENFILTFKVKDIYVTCVQMHICWYVYIIVCACLHVHTQLYIYIYVYSCVYVCVCEYIHACKHMCIYLHIFRFTPLTYEGIDILCQPWPPYFWSTIHILENKCSSIKRNQKDKKSWWSQYSVPKNNQLHTRKLQICGNLPV